jgi:hypothetical protein
MARSPTIPSSRCSSIAGRRAALPASRCPTRCWRARSRRRAGRRRHRTSSRGGSWSRGMVMRIGRVSWRCSRRATRSGRRKASALIVILSELKLERRGEWSTMSRTASMRARPGPISRTRRCCSAGTPTASAGSTAKRRGRCWKCPRTLRSRRSSRSGRQGALDALHADFHSGESPSTRRPIAETVFAGRLGQPAFESERDAA